MTENNPHPAWKIYLAIWALLYAAGAYDQLTHAATQPPLAWITLPFDTLALVGLVGFVLRRPLLRPWVWRGFWRTYIVIGVVNIARMYAAAAHKAPPINAPAMALAVALILVVYGPTAYALRAYAETLPEPATR